MKRRCKNCGLEIEMSADLKGKPIAGWLALMLASAMCWLDGKLGS